MKKPQAKENVQNIFLFFNLTLICNFSFKIYILIDMIGTLSITINIS